MNASNDFIINDGILEKYTGTAVNVAVPDGVTEIGMHAFEHCPLNNVYYKNKPFDRLPDKNKNHLALLNNLS